MIKSVTIKNSRNESLYLELKKPMKTGYAITSITGLGPVKANVNISDAATMDGGVYNSARLPSRNIVMSIVYMEYTKENGTYMTIEDLRQELYDYCPVKGYITITIETTNHTVETLGYVEANEVEVFSSMEGSSISILCPDPYFYAVDLDRTSFSSIKPAFAFAFPKECVITPSPSEPHFNTFKMGDILVHNEENIYYEGTSEIGVIIYAHAIGPIHTITITNINNKQTMTINVDMVAGDTLVINTQRNQKSIQLTHDDGETSTTTNVFNKLQKDSKWITLCRKDNRIVYSLDTQEPNIQFLVTNRVSYEGV